MLLAPRLHAYRLDGQPQWLNGFALPFRYM